MRTSIDNCLRLAKEKQDLENLVKELRKKNAALKKENGKMKKAISFIASELRSLRIKVPFPGEIFYSPSGDIRVSHPADGC